MARSSTEGKSKRGRAGSIYMGQGAFAFFPCTKVDGKRGAQNCSFKLLCQRDHAAEALVFKGHGVLAT